MSNPFGLDDIIRKLQLRHLPKKSMFFYGDVIICNYACKGRSLGGMTC